VAPLIARQIPCRQGKNSLPATYVLEKARILAKLLSPSREFFAAGQGIYCAKAGKRQGISPQDKSSPSISAAASPRVILAMSGLESIPVSVSHALSRRLRLAGSGWRAQCRPIA
jgi:hypothetical protein